MTDKYVVISDNFEIRVLENVIYECVNYFNINQDDAEDLLSNDLIGTLQQVFDLSNSEICFAISYADFFYDAAKIMFNKKQCGDLQEIINFYLYEAESLSDNNDDKSKMLDIVTNMQSLHDDIINSLV